MLARRHVMYVDTIAHVYAVFSVVSDLNDPVLQTSMLSLFRVR